MTPSPRSRRRASPAEQVQLMVPLRQSGLSTVGIQQVLGGHLVSDPSDRATIARILAAFATLPAHVRAEIYDYPGGFAQRFDGDAEVKKD